jgi:hypothetical protein
VTTLVRAVAFVVLVCLIAGVATLWTSRASAQLPRPGEDPRPMSARIVDPLPLPVTGDVRVAASIPLPVQVANWPSTAALPFVEEGRCYFIDFNGGTRWRDSLWRVENVQGAWVRVRLAKAGAGASVDLDTGWFNTARVSRISDAVRCE